MGGEPFWKEVLHIACTNNHECLGSERVSRRGRCPSRQALRPSCQTISHPSILTGQQPHSRQPLPDVNLSGPSCGALVRQKADPFFHLLQLSLPGNSHSESSWWVVVHRVAWERKSNEMWQHSFRFGAGCVLPRTAEEVNFLPRCMAPCQQHARRLWSPTSFYSTLQERTIFN
jgi:hypothetical protein